MDAVESFGLDMANCIGQSYDGCSTMSGKINGVQTIIKTKYPKAEYFHCASHCLNLVVNDLCEVVPIRNCHDSIATCINIIWNSSLRNVLLSQKLPQLCNTRWTQRYESIKRFHDNLRLLMCLESWKMIQEIILVI